MMRNARMHELGLTPGRLRTPRPRESTTLPKGRLDGQRYFKLPFGPNWAGA